MAEGKNSLHGIPRFDSLLPGPREQPDHADDALTPSGLLERDQKYHPYNRGSSTRH